MSNLRQIIRAWVQYADDNDGKLVAGRAGYLSHYMNISEPSWVSSYFFHSTSRSELAANPDKGALWPYLLNIDIYHCPRRANHFLTYAAVCAANGTSLDGWYMDSECYLQSLAHGSMIPPNKVGKTVLRLIRMSDIVSPGASERAVFIDAGNSQFGFVIPYFEPFWGGLHRSAPPTYHAGGMPLSFADAHVEYWKWSRDTIDLPRELYHRSSGQFTEHLVRRDTSPKTDEGFYDLQRTQKAIWGRLGY